MHKNITLGLAALTAGAAFSAAGAGGAYAAGGHAARVGTGNAAHAGSVPSALFGVAATSASNAWAVGFTSGMGLTMHWDGTMWRRVPNPTPDTSTVLRGVAATSAHDAWAVGYTPGANGDDTLILHWNGTTWQRIPSPTPADGGTLSGVTATSADNAWAVGVATSTGLTPPSTLIEHWDGKTWKRVPSPTPKAVLFNGLNGVAATSAHDAWAVGGPTGAGKTFVVHWNGTTWSRVASPSPTKHPGGSHGIAGDGLNSVAATSTHDAWAVGASLSSDRYKALIEHWNGARWTVVHSPVRGLSGIFGVAALSARDAWAVGFGTGRTMILHWNGTTWTRVPCPNSAAAFSSVAATSARNAWTVGGTATIVRWNGTVWK